MLFQSVSKGGPFLNVLFYVLQYPFKRLIVLLAEKNLQTLNQRQTRINHGRKLAGHNHDVLFGHLGLEKLDVFK